MKEFPVEIYPKYCSPEIRKLLKDVILYCSLLHSDSTRNSQPKNTRPNQSLKSSKLTTSFLHLTTKIFLSWLKLLWKVKIHDDINEVILRKKFVSVQLLKDQIIYCSFNSLSNLDGLQNISAHPDRKSHIGCPRGQRLSIYQEPLTVTLEPFNTIVV